MKKIVLALIAVVVFSSHDMYLKLDTYFLQPNTSARIQLFNGTFDNSDNAIARDRMADVSLVGNGTRTAVDRGGQYDDFELQDRSSRNLGGGRFYPSPKY